MNQPTPFFITGLPRCRSAFMATLFTWGDSICYHDALCTKEGPCSTMSLQSLLGRLATHRSSAGHSDASNLFVWRAIKANFPLAKWIVVERDFEETLASCQRVHAGVTRDALQKLKDELDELTAALSPLVVKFDEIDVFKCYQMADYLEIDIGPAMRVRQLCDMNIQIHPPILQERLLSLLDNKEAV